jgi:hypothetical protein
MKHKNARTLPSAALPREQKEESHAPHDDARRSHFQKAATQNATITNLQIAQFSRAAGRCRLATLARFWGHILPPAAQEFVSKIKENFPPDRNSGPMSPQCNSCARAPEYPSQ